MPVEKLCTPRPMLYFKKEIGKNLRGGRDKLAPVRDSSKAGNQKDRKRPRRGTQNLTHTTCCSDQPKFTVNTTKKIMTLAEFWWCLRAYYARPESAEAWMFGFRRVSQFRISGNSKTRILRGQSRRNLRA